VSKLVQDVRPAYVEVCVVSGGRKMYHTAQRTRSVLTDVSSVPKFYTKWNPKEKTTKIVNKKESTLRDFYWNEWITLPVAFHNLPKHAKLVYTLFDESSPPKALANASMSLFTDKNTLCQGLQRMELELTPYARQVVLRSTNPSLLSSTTDDNVAPPPPPPSTTTTTTTTNSSLVEPDLYDEMFRLDKRLEMYRRGWGLGHMSGSAHPDTSVVVRFCFLICLFFFFFTLFHNNNNNENNNKHKY
jgi:hypothetical protein